MTSSNASARARAPESASWPAYVMALTAIFLGSLVQLFSGDIPQSVSKAAPRWFDVVFAVASPIGALLVLFALYGINAIVASLRIEQIGCAITAAMGFSYWIAVAIYNEGLPQAGATWLFGGFGAYCAYRVWEIEKVFITARRGPAQADV